MVCIDILSRNEILVLLRLYNLNCVSKIKASSIRKISEKLDLSYYTVRNILKALVYAGLCEKGCPDGNAHTYFLTEKGLKEIEKLKGDLV